MEQDQHKLIGKFTSRYRLNSSEIKDESQPSTEDDESMDELGINRSRYLDDGSGSLEEDINNEDDDDDDDDDEDTDGDGSSEDCTLRNTALFTCIITYFSNLGRVVLLASW